MLLTGSSLMDASYHAIMAAPIAGLQTPPDTSENIWFTVKSARPINKIHIGD